MSTFSIQIDATQLVYRDFIIPGKTDWISSRTIQTLNLEPAGYNFQVGSGYYTDFTFSVTPAGTVDYDASFNAFLSGRGSTTLTIAGFPVTLDARNLSGAGVLLVIPATNEDWISYKTCRMVPASYYSVQQGSGEVTSFDFKLGLDGTFSYDPSYDSSRGGFLAGSGTSTLKFLGYPILVDARAAGGTSLTILPIWGMPSSPTSVQLATLLPAPSFVLYISGAATKAVFSLDVHGNFSFDSSLSPYLELQTFQGLPIIDPDVIGPPDFRQPVAGQAPYELWQQRRSWVDSTLATLKSDREAHDFTFILKEVLGDPLPDLATLKWNLEQGVDIDNTLSQIKALHFTVGSFLRLMTIKAKDDAKQPVQETEWEEIYAILTQVMKVGQFTAWRAEELAKGIILGPQDFWIALKEPKLTLWLATTQDRSTWQQALIARSQPPIIDPDLIGPGDMNNPGGDPAYHLWRARSAWVDTQLSPLQASPQTADGLDAIIQSTLGVPATELVALATERDKGNNINARLAQLTLSNEAFVTLLRMRDLVASGVPVLDSEWADVYSILVQVQKQRTFAVWRQEEHDQHIVLGPDLFQVQAPPSADSPPAQPLPAWRATQEARNNWQDTLQSRIDQEQTVITELQNAVSATEEVTLPLLRNALILATDVVGTGLEKSRWITEHLLIDAEADSCQVTTRIAQAIETVQGILFSVRTDQFKQNFIEPGSQLAAFSSTRNFFDVFVQGTDNGLDVIEFNNGQAFSNSFGGTWTSGPAVTIDRASGGLFPEMHFLIRGTDQAIWHKWFDGGKWNDWESLGGVWTSGPAAAFWRTGSTRQRHLDVFARGADSALWHNWFDGSWHSWESLGGTLTSGPAAASWGAGHLDVFARGSYNTLLHRAFDNNQWGNWESLGGALASAPSAVSWASNRIDVFAQGNDDTLQHMWFDGSWHDWESLGGTLTSGPAASSWDVSQLDVFVQGTDNTLQHKQFDGSWHDWETLPLPPLLTVDDDNFDDEWKWLGSYATWRARALTVLYPENILLPSLRPDKQQTRHFSTLVDQARMNPSFTPLQACELANQYSDYLHDVCNLDIEASCLVSTPTDQGDCLHKRTPPSERPLLYLFARTPWGRAYYSTYDRHGVPYDGKDVPDYGQSAWDTIPGFDTVVVEELLGAVPYLPNEEQQQILLFARVQEKGVTQLVFTTYDLLTQRWTGNIYPLELPSDASYFSVAVEQRDFDTNIPPLLPPLVAIATFPRDSAKGPDGQPLGSWNYIFVRRLNADATGWDSHDFYPVAGNPYVDKEKVSSVLALVSGGDRFYTVFFKGRTDEGGQDLRYGSLEYVILATPPFYIWTSSVEIGDASSQWLGVLHFPINITYAYVGSPASGVTAKMLGHPILDYPGQPATLGHFAVHCGVDQTQVGKLVAYQDTKTGASRAVFKLAPNFSASPAPSDIASVAPSSTNVPFDLTEHLSEAELQARADALMQVFTAAQNDPPTNLIYFEEAFFFIPILFALQLQQSGEYTAALDWFRTVYDYTTLQGKRLIYYGFLTQQPPDPLEDQLNPHIIAQGRPGSYLRFTLISLVRCFLDFADAEFTRDTAETVSQARMLYLTALALLDVPELKQHTDVCAKQIRKLGSEVGDSQWMPAWNGIQQDLASINDPPLLTAAIGEIRNALATGERQAIDLTKVKAAVKKARAALPAPLTLATMLQEHVQRLSQAHETLLRKPAAFEVVQKIGMTVGAAFLNAVSGAATIPAAELIQGKGELPVLRNRTVTPMGNGMNRSLAGTPPSATTMLATLQPLASTSVNMPTEPAMAAVFSVVQRIKALLGTSSISALQSPFCIPPNPIINSLRLHAELNLYKLHHCYNIAGLERQLEPYTAPTDTTSNVPTIGMSDTLVLPGTVTLHPTPYRYTVLIERAKQLVQLAAQTEAAMLSALEKRDSVAYNLLKARQDVRLTHAQVELQNLRVGESLDGMQLATLQQNRAQSQVNHYQTLIDNGLSTWEIAALGFQGAAVVHMHIGASISLSAAIEDLSFSGIGSGISQVGSALAATASLLQTQASFERRNEEWQFQKDLALKDVGIGAQQLQIAQDQARIAGQEYSIATIQANNAESVVDFLSNQFTNEELYQWMSTVLERVYRFFLQQATAIAQLAANQLAFERQQVPPPFIQADYWEVPTDSGSTNSNTPDRRGLTGSARLLQDIYQLDQYAFLTNTRKLQLTKIISLAQFSPAEFQRFRETGVLTFATTMAMFDREFPGHYLRLIKRVRTSVIALVPPTLGIRATLSASGTSRVVIQSNGFQNVVVRRDPQSVALSSPRDATGLFVDLEPQQDMLLPFEGWGVDTNWELRMPKAANQFDFRTIADVLITLDYTAFESTEYRQQITKELNARPFFSADRPFSFRNDLADQWYDLHNPEQIAAPVTGQQIVVSFNTGSHAHVDTTCAPAIDQQIVVSFNTQRDDFPPNITDLKIQQVVLYFARAEGKTFEVQVCYLHFTEQGSTTPLGGPATSVDGIISTRTGRAANWISMLGKSPFGQWDLAFPETLPSGEKTSDVFKNEEIEDILFVITFLGRTPEWPV